MTRQTSLSDIRRTLQSGAITLSSEHQLPLHMPTLLRRAGLDLEVATGGPGGAHGELARRDGRWVVVIPQEANGRLESPRARFTMAHELAHYLVEREFAERPRTRKEYWELESVCNEFAGWLLVPEPYLGALRGERTSAQQLLGLVYQVRRETNVSTEVAARRLVEGLAPHAAFLGLGKGKQRAGGSGWIVHWSAPTEGKFSRGRRKVISTSDPLHPAVAALDAAETGVLLGLRLSGAADACVHRTGMIGGVLSILGERPVTP